MSYNFTQTAQVPGSNWKVSVDPVAKYGYFECQRTGTEGGLWFEMSDEGPLELIDFDGTYELPPNVAKAIESLGYFVSNDFTA